MIENSKERKFYAELQKLSTSTTTFRLKYNGYPGDLANATQFWGTDASCPATPYNTVKKQATCNGNNNGKIAVCCGDETYEMHRYWQHLSNAGLFEGSFTGASGPGVNYSVEPYINTPPSVYGGCMTLQSTVAEYGGQGIWIGTFTPTSHCTSPLFTPLQIKRMDTKFDDGRYNSGFIISFSGGDSPNCISGGDYNIALTTPQCVMRYALWLN